MQKRVIEKNISNPNEAQLRFLAEDNVFFDIETTGLSADNSFIYLISYGRTAQDSGIYKLNMTMLFCDKGTVEDEALLINTFFNDIRSANKLISYNGLSFDERYIRRRCRHLDIDDSPLDKIHIDLYKELYPYAGILGLENRKLQTVEKYLNTGRKDTASGGDLIKVYKDYLLSPSNKAIDALLLHNEDDVAGLIHVCSLCAVDALFKGGFDITDADVNDGYLEYTLDLAEELPRLISANNNIVSLYARQSRALIKIKIYNGELKHYFQDYKNYIYLPDDDTAVHKDVEFMYMEKQREKAKKDTAYIKINDSYIPVFEDSEKIAAQGVLIFCDDIKNKKTGKAYMPLPRDISISCMAIHGYCITALNNLLKNPIA